MSKHSRGLSRRRLIGTSVAATAVLGTGTLAWAGESSSGSSAGSSRRSARSASSTGSANKGIPTGVNAATGLAAQGDDAGSDSIYFTSHVKAKGHTFGVLVQTVHATDADARVVTITVSDQTTGWYKAHQVNVNKEDYTWSTEKLDIKAPGLTWSGTYQKMSVQASTPWGSLDFVLESTGPVLYYAGTGEFDMLGARQYEFALPSLRTTGTLTVEGDTYRVTGESWLDRQWGALPLGGSNHWTWMNLSLSSGDRVAIWDFGGDSEQYSWATVLRPNGSYELAEVRPLADNASDTWTSPDSGRSFPTRWRVEIPALKTDLDVRVVGAKGQEIGTGRQVRYEATANVTGTFEGRRVTGHNYVEIIG